MQFTESNLFLTKIDSLLINNSQLVYTSYVIHIDIIKLIILRIFQQEFN